MPGKVRNMITLGGPHMGVDAIPNCYEGFMCNIINSIAKKLVYLDTVQNIFAPAGYFRDVNNMSKYISKSVFLPALNNEHSTHKGKLSDIALMRKGRFTDINQAMFVMFEQDTMIYPKETAWF